MNNRLQLVPTEARKRGTGSELERELEQLIAGSSYTHDEGEELSKAERTALESLSVEEARVRRIELQKHRHLQSTYQQKARRTKKIKSRNFHRHLKKREKKEAEKEILMEGNEGEMEEKKIKERAAERATLKHSSTGSKWSQGNKKRGVRYMDGELLENVNEQARHREQLKQRVEFEDEEEEEEVEEKQEEKETKIITSTEVLGELGVDNEWLKDKEEEQIMTNLEDAINTDGITVVEDSGVMLLPEMRSTIENSNESDQETEIEKELRNCLEGIFNKTIKVTFFRLEKL